MLLAEDMNGASLRIVLNQKGSCQGLGEIPKLGPDFPFNFVESWVRCPFPRQ